LGPYLDALATGPVGARRSAAEGLVSGVRRGDGPWLVEALARSPEGARFALARALGKVGDAESLHPLLALLTDPFAQREAAEAAAEVALRTGQLEAARKALAEPGLGATWRWSARTALGDESWVQALQAEWPRLAPPFRLQALEASRSLPEPLKAVAKSATAEATGQVRTAWESL
jgi:HEAT repeat protein